MGIKRRHKRLVFIADITSLALFVSATVGFAQNAQLSGTSEVMPGLQEVVVTATKRATTIQSTPISITAVTGDQLLASGVSSVENVALMTPGVAMTSQGPGRTTYTIRGMSPTGGATPTVGYYIDDAPISAPAAQFSGRVEVSPDLYDINRVEILRGPQGTLFGAGSMGGTVRIITNSPKLHEYEYSAEASGSETEHGGLNYATNGMINLPLGGKFALRLVASDRFDDGYIDRVVINPFPPPTGADLTVRGDVLNAPVENVYKNVNDSHVESFRIEGLAQLTDAFSIKPSVYYMRTGQAGSNTVDLPPGQFRQYQPYDIREGFREYFSLYSLVVKYDFTSFSISSDSSIADRSNRTGNNDSENYYSLFGTGFFTPGPTFTGVASREATEELRITSSGSGPLQWLGGLFYDDFRDVSAFTEEAPAYVPVFGESQIFDFAENDSIRQFAAFGNLTYDISNSLSATAGVRWSKYNFSFSQAGIGIVIPPQNQTASGSTSHTAVTPMASIKYSPSDSQMYYVSAARGFRPGAPNPPIPGNISQGVDCATALAGLGLSAAPRSYDPDDVWSYEIGGKATLNNRLQVDADVYHLNWNNIQQGFALSCGFNFTANAGDAIANGAELDIVFRAMDGLTVRQSIGYVDARITHERIGSLSVDQVQGVPKWTLNSGVEYTHPIGGKWSLLAHADDQFTGRQYDPGPNPFPLTYRAGFNVVNLRIGVKRGLFRASLFVNNVTDRFAVLGYEPALSANIQSLTRAVPLTPRTAGVDFQWSY